MGLGVEVEAAEVGFDADRLARIDRHFARYVDDGRLPGWLVLVSRARARSCTWPPAAGATSRPACRSSSTPVFRIYSMTKPITVGGGDDALRGGRLRAEGPGQPLHPRPSPTCAVYRTGSALDPRHRAGDRADADLAPAHPHRRPHLRVPPRPPGRRHVPARPGSSGGTRTGVDLAACCDALGRAAAAVPAGQRVELLGGHRRARPGGRGGVAASRSTGSSPSASSGRSA